MEVGFGFFCGDVGRLKDKVWLKYFGLEPSFEINGKGAVSQWHSPPSKEQKT